MPKDYKSSNNTRQKAEEMILHFLNKHDFECNDGKGIKKGINKINSLNTLNQSLNVYVNSCGQIKDPRWFQISISGSKLHQAKKLNLELNNLWIEKIDSVDFWFLVSVPKREIWIFPPSKLKEIAILNEPFDKGRELNDFSMVYYNDDKKPKDKQKELNLDVTNEKGIKLYNLYESYKNNFDVIKQFT